MAGTIVASDIFPEGGLQFKYSSGQYFGVPRIFKVSGFQSGSGSGVDTNFFSSILATSGLPGYNDQHPANSNLFASEFDVRMISHCMAWVTVYYSPWSKSNWSGTAISINATSQFVETSKDVNGLDLTVRYGDEKPKVASYQKFLPQVSVNITRREYNDPSWTVFNYKGTINSGTYRSGAQGTWLLSDITCDNYKGSTTVWDVTYSLRYYEYGWNNYQYVGWQDKNGQLISPSDPNFKSGYGSGSFYFVSGYKIKDWSSLNLP